MHKGIVEAKDWLRKFFAYVLIVIIVLCAAILVFVSLSKSWTVFFQVGSAVAGAALGNILRLDVERSSVQNQARSAIRRLFDQAARLGGLVERVESYGDGIRNNAEHGIGVDSERISDLLESIGYNIRQEITSTATAIEDWGDLSQTAYGEEVERYRNRDSRMPFDKNE